MELKMSYYFLFPPADGALVWSPGGSGFPRWCPVERPNGCASCSSFTSGRSLNPPWKLRSKSSQGAKVKGFSVSRPPRRARHPSSIWARTAAGQWAGSQKIWGARTWNPQKFRIPFWRKTNQHGGFLDFQTFLPNKPWKHWGQRSAFNTTGQTDTNQIIRISRKT